MNKEIPDASSQNNVIISLPVNITYAALAEIVQEKARGEIIKVEKEDGSFTSYAQILDVSFQESLEDDFDLLFDIKLKTLTTVFKNKVARLLLDVSLDYNEHEQVVSVKDYKLDIKSGNWLMNNSLEAVANKFIYGKLRKKMMFDLKPEIDKRILELNQKMEDPMEVMDGINLFGQIDSFSIGKIIPKPGHFLVLLNLNGNAVVDVEKIILPKSETRDSQEIS